MSTLDILEYGLHQPIILVLQKKNAYNFKWTTNYSIPGLKGPEMLLCKFPSQCCLGLKDENGTLITDRVEIANARGEAIEKSSLQNYSKEFQSIKAQRERQKINFKTNRNLRYIEIFKTILKEVQWFISKPRSDPLWNFTPLSYLDSLYYWIS